MKERGVLQLVILLLILSLTGCQLLALPLALVQNLLPFIVDLLKTAGPALLLFAEVDTPQGPLDSQLAEAIKHPDKLPRLSRQALLSMAREHRAKSVALIDVSKLPPRQIQLLVRRLSAVPGSKLLLADASQLVGSPAARQALVEGLAKDKIQLWDDGSLQGERARSDQAYADWRAWLDQEQRKKH